jgi:FkbM family methyltransferase
MVRAVCFCRDGAAWITQPSCARHLVIALTNPVVAMPFSQSNERQTQAIANPPEVRWDRHMQSQISAASEAMQTNQNKSGAGSTVGRGSTTAAKQWLKARVRGPLRRLRDFFTAPALDAVNRLHVRSERQLAQLDAQLATLNQQVVAAQTQVVAVQAMASGLHSKVDALTFGVRPVMQLGDAHAVPLADGYLFVPTQDEDLLLMYAAAGPFGLEPGARRILQIVAPEGGHAIDVGASVGLHTLALGRAIGSGGRIDAFEAEPRLEKYLDKTFHLNGLSMVRLHRCAIGAEESSAQFHVAKTIGHSSLYNLGGDAERETVTVDVKTIDDILDDDAKVDVIKIDVEGAELDVVRGADRVLRRSPNVAVLAECGPSHLARIGVSLEEWLDVFFQYGFIGYAIAEPSGQLYKLDVSWLAAQHSVNIIFVRPSSLPEAAILSVPGLLVSGDAS